MGIPTVRVLGLCYEINILMKHWTVTENCRRIKGIWNCFGGGG
jgi:hypothetical protein